MSLARKLLLLTVLVAMLSASHPVQAELYEHKPMLPDCCDVDHNFAWFEPIYCDCTEEPPYSTGIFFSFQQLFMSVTRASEAPGGVQFGDSTNGSRYDFGYMYEDTGWFASILKINNPGKRLVDTNVSRNEVAVDGEDIVGIIDLAGNNIGDTYDTLNGLNIYGAELNHLWRLEPTYRGLLFEPFLGLRYLRFRDHFDTASYDLFTAAIPGFGPPNTVVAFSDQDFFTREEVTTDNDMFGGQFGTRIGRRHGRWLVNVDVRGFTFHNFVTRTYDTLVESNEQIILATYDAAGVLTSTADGDLLTDTNRQQVGADYGRFVYGGELRADLGFEITKMFEVHVGAELLVLGDGVARGYFDTDQPFTAGGVTLGFAINR